MCSISKEDVEPGKIFHISVECEEECKFTLIPELVSEYNLVEGQLIEETIYEKETIIYRFTIGSDTNIKTATINLALESTDLSKVQMYCYGQKDGNFVPGPNLTYSIQQTWLGYAASFSEGTNTNPMCRDCTYKVAIKSAIETSFSLTFRTNKAVTILKRRMIDIYENLQGGQYNCYQYNVIESTRDFEIYLSAYSGNPIILINPRELPKLDQSKFKFKSSPTPNSKSFYLLTQEQRKQVEAIIGNYYVCIYSENPSYYNLLLRMKDKNNQSDIPLYDGLTRNMFAKESDLTVFKYEIESNEKTYLTFTLSSDGYSNYLFIKACGDSISCNMTQEELWTDSNSNIIINYAYGSKNSIDVTFDPRSLNCMDKTCFYLVGVILYSGWSTEQTFISYSLAVTPSTKTEIILLSGIPYTASMDMNDELNFKYSVDLNNTDALNVKFQLTPINGLAILKVDHYYPENSINRLKETDANSYYPEVIIYSSQDGENLQGNYRITLTAKTASTFDLVAYTNDKNPSKYTPSLTPGYAQFGTLATKEASMLYAFGVSFPKTSKRDIVINFLPLSGRYIIYVIVDNIPSSTNYYWKFESATSNLFIRDGDPNYKKTGIYYVLVSKANLVDTTNHTFAIKYFMGNHIQNIIEGFPEVGNLMNKGISFYKYLVNDYEESISVVITPLTGDISTYIAGGRLPSNTNYTYSTSEVGSDILKFQPKTLFGPKKECKDEKGKNTDCAVYIGVFCASYTCSYSLLLSLKSGVALRLANGIPQFGTANERPGYYAYIPYTSNAPTLISVQSQKGKVAAYLKYIPWTKSFKYDDNKNLPHRQDNNYTFDYLATSQFANIQENNLTKCGEKCVIFVGVYKDPKQDYSSEYSITASNSIANLIEGNTIVDKVEKNEFKYYMFYTYCDNCSIYIATTPLTYSSPLIYVSKGFGKYPKLNDFDFAAASNKGEVLTINLNDPYFNNTQNATTQGVYMIGLYGHTAGAYSLAVTTSETPFQELKLGIPTKQEQRQKEIKYFTFASYKNNTIVVRTVIHSGRVIIRANVIPSDRERNITNKFPKKDENSTWSSNIEGTLNYLILSHFSKPFIPTGVFLIAVEAVDGSNYDITVDYSNAEEFSFMQLGRPFRAHLHKNERIRLGFYTLDFNKIEIKLDVLYGTVKGKLYSTDQKEIADLIPDGLFEINSTDLINRQNLYAEIISSEESDIIFRAYPEMSYFPLDEGIAFNSIETPNISVNFSYNLPSLFVTNEESVRLNVYASFDKPLLNGLIVINQMVIDKKKEQNTYVKNDIKWKTTTIYYNDKLKSLGDSVLLNLTESEVVFITLVANFRHKTPKVNYSITAWTKGIIILEPGVYMPVYHDDNSMTQIFEQIVYEPTNVSIEVAPCIGQVKFLVTSGNRNDPKVPIELEVKQIKEGRLFGTFEAKPGKHFIYVTSDASSDPYIRYQIASFFSNSKDTLVHGNYYLENNGKVEYHHSGHKIHLKWGKVMSSKTKNATAARVEYGIYIAETDAMNMRTPCGIYYSESELLGIALNEQDYTTDVPSRFHMRKSSIGIIAYVIDSEETLVYQPIRLYGNTAGGFNFIYCNNNINIK